MSGFGNSSRIGWGGGGSFSGSSIPSSMLEQEAQIFGFLESTFHPAAIASPQQIQIRGIIPHSLSLSQPSTNLPIWQATASKK
jgi:hypothetical protein